MKKKRSSNRQKPYSKDRKSTSASRKESKSKTQKQGSRISEQSDKVSKAFLDKLADFAVDVAGNDLLYYYHMSTIRNLLENAGEEKHAEGFPFSHILPHLDSLHRLIAENYPSKDFKEKYQVLLDRLRLMKGLAPKKAHAALLSTVSLHAVYSGLANLWQYFRTGDGQSLYYAHYDALGVYAYLHEVAIIMEGSGINMTPVPYEKPDSSIIIKDATKFFLEPLESTLSARHSIQNLIIESQSKMN